MLDKQVRKTLEEFISKAYKCQTTEQARTIREELKVFYSEHKVPAEYDIFLKEGVGEMLAILAQ